MDGRFIDMGLMKYDMAFTVETFPVFDGCNLLWVSPVCDKKRRLVCSPYSIPVLHAVAKKLGIKKHWFHKDHYDIPKRRVDEIMPKCWVVDTKEIICIKCI